MKALPIKFYDKRIGKKVQAFEVDFPLCFDENNREIKCEYYPIGPELCCCDYVHNNHSVNYVIFLEVKE